MSELNHPCRDTCSGWRQGFEKGRESMRAKIEAEQARSAKLFEAVKETVESQDDLIFDIGLVEALAEYEASCD